MVQFSDGIKKVIYTKMDIFRCILKEKKHFIREKLQQQSEEETKIKKIDVDNKFLNEIFPKDFKCPALGIKMEWSGELDTSPALDKLNPNKHYTKDNVCWISFRANSIKTDADYEEILMVGKWMKKMGI